MRHLIALIAILALSGIACAQSDPLLPPPGDPRIQLVTYNADQVVQLQITPGYQTMLEFAADEKIESVALGDSSGWQAMPNKRGDYLFIKAQGEGATNLTVVTTARVYLFELMEGFGNAPVYVVRFQYNKPQAFTAAPQPGSIEPSAGKFKVRGSRTIRPNAMDDDGQKTYISWNKEQPLPAIFLVDGRGRETLANGAMRGERYVIDAIANHIVFRLDEQVVTATRVPQVKP